MKTNSMNSRFSSGLTRLLLSGLMATGFFLAANTAFADGSGNADVETGIGCMEDLAMSSFGCTAGDITIPSATNILILDDGCAFIGDTVTFSADFEVLLTAQARHDIGLWFSTDGDPNGDAAKSGMCAAATPAYAPDPPWFDLDGTSDDPNGVIQDTCGDIDSSHNPLFPSVTLTTVCVDEDGDGQLDLPNCTSWRQPGGNDLCTSPSQALPAAPSKCKCDEGFGVAIDVPGQITGVDKVTLDLNGDPLPGDPTVFEFSLTGPDADLPDDFTLTDAQVPHVTPGLDAGDYNLSEAAQEGWELVSAVCTSAQGNPDQDLVASGGSLTVGSGEGLSCTFTNQQTFVPSPELTVDKELTDNADEDESGTISLGDTLTYLITATNTGNVTLNNVVVSDDLTGESTTCLTVEPEATCELTGIYVVTQEDVDAGHIVNTGTADSDETDPIEDPNDEPVSQNPVLSLAKSLLGNADEDGSGTVSVNDTLTYQFVASNDGDVTLTGVAIVDPMPGLSALSCVPVQPATLAPAATMTCTATYVVTPADIAAGVINNTATADSDQTDPVPDSEIVPIEQDASMSVEKALTGNADEDGSGSISVDDTLEYTITATNTGDVTLNNVTVSDDLTGDSTSCLTVAPGVTCVLTVTYVVTQADVDAGQIVNTGTADSDETDPVDDTETVSVPTPSLETNKALLGNADEDGSGDVSEGDTLTYRITVENNGTANLTNVTVDDDLTGTVDALCAALLAPTESCFVDVTYVVTAADVTAGVINNTATGDSDQAGPVDDTETVNVPTPSLETNKALLGNADEDGSGDVSVGDTLTYRITVENNGTANLTNVTVDDDLTGTVDAFCSALLAPADSCFVDVTYVVTAADVVAGEIVNIGTGDSDQTPPVPDTETETLPTPSLETDKALLGNADEDGSGDVSEGDTLTYRITVENNGTANLTNVTVDDSLTGTVDALCAALLAPAMSCSVDVTYMVTAADVIAGVINNTATGDSDQTDPVDDIETVNVPTPSLTTDKALHANDDEDGSGDVSEGDTLTYRITVENNGTANLTNVTVDDDLTGTVDALCAALLAPAMSCFVDVTYVVTAADVAAGEIVNIGTGDSDQTPPVPDTETETLPTPSLDTDKALLSNADEDNSGDVSEGDTLTYRVTVENNGTANLTNVTVDDSLTGTVDAFCSALLAPAASCFVDVTYVVTAADVIAGVINNTATGDSDQTDPVDDIETVNVPTPSLDTDKALHANDDEDDSGDVSAGDTLTYRITVENNGTANLTNVTVDDSLTGAVDLLCAALLAPAESCFVDVSYVVTAADVAAGEIVNIGTGDSDQTDPVDDIETVDLNNPSLTTNKALHANADEDGSGDVSEGDTLTYRITVENNGSANLTDVTVDDDLTGTVDGFCSALLAPAASCFVDVTYVVTAADVTAGVINNTATGDAVQAGPVDDIETVNVPTPSLTTDKALHANADEDGSGDVSEGDTLTYRITVENNGTANLTNVTVDDDLTGTVDAFCSALLAPAMSCFVDVTYVVTAADVANGQIINTATGDSDQTDPVNDIETVNVPTPSLDTDKALISNADEDGSLDVSAGDTLTYRITVENNGSANLTNVTVDDDLTGTVDALCSAFLAPAMSCFVDVTYVVTVTDVTNGVINNTATGDSDQTDPVDDIETVNVPTPSLDTDKALISNADEDGSLDVSAGDTLTYRITVENNGSANLTNVTVDDDLTGTVDALCSAFLAPAMSCFVDVTYVVTVTDVTNGVINNTATGDSDQTDPVNDIETVNVPTPSLDTDKALISNADEDGSLDVSVGDTLTYRITVENNGSANLTDVTVDDDLTGTVDGFCSALLAPAASCFVDVTYVVTAADVIAGVIDNTGTGDSVQTDPVDDIETVNVPTPSLDTDKALISNADEDGSLDVSAGDTLTYRITVENNGTANLTNVTVDDDLTGTVDALCAAFLAPTESCVVDVTYMVTAADVIAGVINNTATGDSVQTDPVDDTETVNVPTPSLAIDKQVVSIINPDLTDGGTSVDQVFDKITYDIVVTNTGTANLTNVTVDDDLTGTVDVLCSAFLAPTESCTVTVMYTVTQADLDSNGTNPTGNGFIDNTGTADSVQTDPVSDSEQVLVDQNPSIDLVKTFADDSVIAGGPGSSFELVVTNDGNITLHNIVVSDAVNSDLTVTTVDCGGGTDSTAGQNVNCTFDTLNVGDSRTITVYFEVDPSVPEALGVNNTATADGTSDTAGDVSDSDSDTIDILIEIDLSITKIFYTIDDDGNRVEDGKVEQGMNGFFELIVSNAGPSDALDVLVTDAVNELLGVVAVLPQPECAASSGQDVSCTFYIPVVGSATVTVEYTAAEYLDPDEGAQFGTQEGDEFKFVFVNGYVLEGSTDGGPVFLTDPDGNVEELEFNGTKNEIVFDPPFGASFTMHLSCSDAFTGGWGDSGGPDEFDNTDWQIASYSILRYHNGGNFFKGCGDVVVPWNVDNTAFADGKDSNSPPDSELVSDTDTVQIIRQLKIEIRGEPVAKGKKLDVLLNNTGKDSLTITQIVLSWPDANNENGNLVAVKFGNATIYATPEFISAVTITGPWLGTEADRTIDPGEALKLAFFFAKKTKPTGYEVTITLEGGLTTEVTTVTL